MNSKVNQFLAKSTQWKAEMAMLQQIIKKSKLKENFKWSKPCYSYNDMNIVIIQPFKACLGLMFFKGTLLKDPEKLLVNNGPNSQSARRMEFRSKQEITKAKSAILTYIKEAIEIEVSGKKVSFKKNPEPIPTELKNEFVQNTKLKAAFSKLTPGRQRAYILHISSAKQTETRTSRIKKCIPRILLGKGLNDK